MGNPRVQKEILDAINIIVSKRMNDIAKILFGTVVGLDGQNFCTININGVTHKIRYYGNVIPDNNKKYPLFVPSSGMSQAFIITGVSSGGDGSSGDAVVYTPSISSDGVLSWTNNGDLPNPSPVNIKGPQGKTGATGAQGPAGADGKSAYQYAVDGGYTGTETAFAKKLAEEIDASYISERIESKVPFMKYGRALESGTDLNNIVPASANDGISGTYYSPSSTVTASLLNCPFSGAGFTMDVSYATGNDYRYIRQEIKSYSKGDWVRTYSNGTWSDWMKTVKTGSAEWNNLVRVESIKRHPSLTNAQKSAIKALIRDYWNNRTTFYYEWDHTRNAFADGSAYNSENGKWKLNCGTFVQNILMGRSVNDYVGKTADTYSNTITKTDVSDFGYYFEHENRKIAYGLAKNSSATTPSEYYYGYTKPLANSYKYSYSRNSYWTQSAENAGNIGGQHFRSYMTAADLAFELYKKGCEISMSELEVGDILFNKHQGDDETESSTFFSKMSWRNIAHVFMVYDISADGNITLVECTDYSTPIMLREQNSTYNDARTRFVYLMQNTVFCARLPSAWTGTGNVPNAITAI